MDVINRLPKLIGIVILTGLLLSVVLGFMGNQIGALAPNIVFGGQADTQATFFPKGDAYGGIQVNLNYAIHNDFSGGDEIKITVSMENRMNESADLRAALHKEGGDVDTWWPGQNEWKNMLVGEKWQVSRNTDWKSATRARFDGGFNITVYHEEVGYIGHINTTDEDVEDVRGCWVCVDW